MDKTVYPFLTRKLTAKELTEAKPDHGQFSIGSLFFMLAVTFCIVPAALKGQSMTGAVTGSYAGVSNASVNPALMANSRYYVDVNLMGGQGFFHNNYAYIGRDDYRFPGIFMPGYEFNMHQKEYGQGERPAYTVNGKRPKQMHLSGNISGPSVMVAANGHTFALLSSFRSVHSMRDIPYDMANYFYYSLDYKPQHGMEYEHRDPMRFATLTWSEFGAGYAYMFGKHNRDRWAFGITARLLFGHSASYAWVEHLKYFTPDDETVYVRNLDGEAAYSLPVHYASNDLQNPFMVRGMGAGFDIGLAYIHTRKGHSDMKYKRLCQQRFEEYKYRIGISLTDLGWISFGKDARKYEYDNVSGLWEQVDTLKPYYSNLEYISRDLSDRFYGSPEGGLTGRQFNMYLPASLGMQFDYHYVNNWYLSASFRYPLLFSKSQVRAPASLMIAPRLETQVFEAGMPFIVHDLRHPMLGAYMRFYNITLGTSNLAGIFNLTDHYGFDIYLSVKISFAKNRCKKKMPRFCADDFRFREKNR